MKNENLKQVVKEKYGSIASKASSCCNCCDADYSDISDDYKDKKGYAKDADLNLGCGIPTDFADIKPGDHVLDLGAGAGNDCFVARAIVGDSGKVTGLDFTEEMIAKARINTNKLGYNNVEFIYGDIENMPVPNDSFDVVISNCVMNLVPDKQKGFSEVFRVLKQGGHFCISDLVVEGELPASIRKSAEMYAGCVSGATSKKEYLDIICRAGFESIGIKKERLVIIPDDTLLKVISASELKELKESRAGIYSITVVAKKRAC